MKVSSLIFGLLVSDKFFLYCLLSVITSDHRSMNRANLNVIPATRDW